MISIKYLISGFCTIAILVSANSAIAAEFKVSDDPLKEPSAEVLTSQLQTEKRQKSKRGDDARKLANKWVREHKFGRGWDKKKQRIVQVGWSGFNTEDPAWDDSYITARSLAAMEAKLAAKAKIIEYVSVDMSAFNHALIPGTDLEAKFKKRIRSLERKMESQRKKVALLLQDLDAKEADNLRGATLADRLPAALDAAISKLDENYKGKEGIEQDKLEKVKEARDSFNKASKELEKLQEEVAVTKGDKKKEQVSEVDMLAEMPLFGATTLASFESWDEESEKYKVAVVVMWSVKMEQIVRGMLKGESVQVSPGPETMEVYLYGKDPDNPKNWCMSMGGRRFRDENGNVWFIGIGSADLGETTSDEELATGEAEAFAAQEVAMSIFSDVMSHKNAKRRAKTRSTGKGKEGTIADSTYSRELHEEIKNRKILGLTDLSDGGFQCTHEISQRELIVSIYGISQDEAIGALKVRESSYVTAILDATAQQVVKGSEAGMKAEVTKAKQDPKAYSEAAQTSGEKVRKKADAEVAPVQSNLTTGQQDQGEAKECPQGQTCPKKKAQSGSAAGAGQDDASW